MFVKIYITKRKICDYVALKKILFEITSYIDYADYKQNLEAIYPILHIIPIYTSHFTTVYILIVS